MAFLDVAVATVYELKGRMEKSREARTGTTTHVCTETLMFIQPSKAADDYGHTGAPLRFVSSSMSFTVCLFESAA